MATTVKNCDPVPVFRITRINAAKELVHCLASDGTKDTWMPEALVHDHFLTAAARALPKKSRRKRVKG